VFPVRYGLNSYINLLRNSVFEGTTLPSRGLYVEVKIASAVYGLRLK
jgi:hypothetical protein